MSPAMVTGRLVVEMAERAGVIEVTTGIGLVAVYPLVNVPDWLLGLVTVAS